MSTPLRAFALSRSASFGVALAGLGLVVACGGTSGSGSALGATGAGSSSGGTFSGSSSGAGSSSGGFTGSSSGGGGSGSVGGGTSGNDAGMGGGDAAEDTGTTSAPADGGSGSADGGAAGSLNPNVAPGGNFDLSIWQLQEPVGSPGSPTTFSPAELEGAGGHQDKYFYTDPSDGSMVFWDPENGVTTPNSNYPRSELREMTAGGAAANWAPTGTNTLSATLKATVIPSHAAVGQIHLGTGTPSSTKPLLELFYDSSGQISIGIEQTPAGGNEVQTPVGNVPLGTQWSYVIGLSGNTISLTINGGTPQTFTMSSTFDQEGMYFKAGNYDQSVGTDSSVASQVQFYALSVVHTP